MNELIYQPTFDENNKINGCIMLVNMFGLSGLIFCFKGVSIPRKWRNELIGHIFTELLSYVLMKDKYGEVPLTEQQKYIRSDPEWFQFEWEDELNRSNLYVYSHTPTKPGGYVRVLTEPDDNEDGNLKIEEQEYYPKDVGNAGPVEKFLYDYIDEFDIWCRMPESIKKNHKETDFYWHFGDDLQLDEDIYYLYFNDTVEWNELYWDLYQAIGRPWKRSDYIEAWRTNGNETEKHLIAEHDAQRLLFWCMENDYSLDNLYQMVAEKRIITKRILATNGDWMTLQYGL